MAYDKANRRLYVDTSVTPNKGISLHEISLCLQDYRRDANGNVDLGMMCTSNQLNIWTLFRPYNSFTNLTGETTLEDRRYSDYGLIVNSVIDADDSWFTRWGYEMNIAPPYRILDFDGYSAYEKCGFGITATNVVVDGTLDSFSTSIKMNGNTGYNITWEHVNESLVNFDSLESFGIELRSKKGSIPILTEEVGTHSELASLLSSSHAVSLLSLLKCPVGYGAELYIYGKSDHLKHSLIEPITITDTRTSSIAPYYYYGHFSPNMMIGTFLSGMKSVNEWWRTGDTIVIGENDFFRMGFFVRRDSSLTSANRCYLKATSSQGTYFLPVYYLSSDGSWPTINVWGTLGPTSYDGVAVFNCSYIDFVDTVLTYGIEDTVTLQLCELNVSTGEGVILTPPIQLTLLYNGNDPTSGEDYPDFPPIPDPDWTDEDFGI